MTPTQDFISYIETLCTLHPGILHNPEAEKISFLALDQLANRGKMPLKFPVVVFDRGGFRYSGAPDAQRKMRSYSLLFLTNVPDVAAITLQQAAYLAMEQLADDFMKRMMQDKLKRQTPCLRLFDIAAVEVSLIEHKTALLYGVSCDWEMPELFDLALKEDTFNTL